MSCDHPDHTNSRHLRYITEEELNRRAREVLKYDFGPTRLERLKERLRRLLGGAK